MTPRPLRLLGLGSVLAVVVLTQTGCATTTPELPSDLPEDFELLLPRGQIASVDAPEFVTADEAEIADDAWILGVEIDGEARAYSLNLLNSHEIVNDRIGEQSFAAVW